jgi:hypothetical protein
VNEAIKQIDAELARLRGNISTLEQARELLASVAVPPQNPTAITAKLEAAGPEPREIQPQRATFVRASVASAIRYAVSQMRGQFLTGDIIRAVNRQGYTGQKVGDSVSGELWKLQQSGVVTCVTKRRGNGGNTWIKTSELEAATTPAN